MNENSDAKSSIGYLDENYNVVPCTVEELLQSERIYCDFKVQTKVGDVTVSTTFLRTRHYPDDWFETALFYTDGRVKVPMRYETYQQAVEGHDEVVDRVKNQEVFG